MYRIFFLGVLLLLPACGEKTKTTASAPAKTEVIAHEAELLKLTLTPEAVERLGIVTARVGDGQAARMRETAEKSLCQTALAAFRPDRSATFPRLGTMARIPSPAP